MAFLSKPKYRPRENALFSQTTHESLRNLCLPFLMASAKSSRAASIASCSLQKGSEVYAFVIGTIWSFRL